MQTAVHFLYDSDLDFAIRSTGTGSVSARDVIISTQGFKSWFFDKAAETVTVGAGLDWGEVDALMEDGAPGARPYAEKVFGGLIALPYSALQETAKGVAAMSVRTADPKVAMHVVNVGPGLGMPDQGARPGIGIMMFGARGEAHARSKDGFAWAFEMLGAQEISTSECTMRQMHAVAETFRNYQGSNMFWLSAPLIDGNLDDELLVRTWKWYEDSIEAHPGFGAESTVLLEFMQENAFSSSPSCISTGWPHSSHRHILQLVLRCKPETAPRNIQEIAMKRLQAAGRDIAGDRKTGEFHPGFLNEWNDLRQIYGGNYDRLMELRKRFDPDNRFNKGEDLGRAKIRKGMTM
ncbi:hypothetical protein LTR02_017085 [Friedmanniomyces endolithicus]|nr:hypothetical protein LTR02_017085 [Friedmanniomyces endolithicus]